MNYYLVEIKHFAVRDTTTYRLVKADDPEVALKKILRVKDYQSRNYKLTVLHTYE